VGPFRQRFSPLFDKRNGKNSRYGMKDATLLNVFGVFFTQAPLFLVC
jgi:hypothetical protein